jgi:hypothetical protein
MAQADACDSEGIKALLRFPSLTENPNEMPPRSKEIVSGQLAFNLTILPSLSIERLSFINDVLIVYFV